ncbi:MAG: bifunctional molybdenum cofactor biosynthesis protein MoaC/MoaB [Hyphomicrobiales bacterium]
MRDVSQKPTTHRTARAEAVLRASAATVDRVRAGAVPKGDPLATARVSGIAAAKRTPDLLPFCHPIPLTHADVTFEVRESEIVVTATVAAVWRTGVEMEALTAASTAALTLYDMLKPIDDALEIARVRLLEKRGGLSDLAGSAHGPREAAATRAARGHGLHAAIVVASDRAAAGTREDRSGPAIAEALRTYGVAAATPIVVTDDRDAIEDALRRLCDQDRCDLVFTSGGTGLAPRDVTVEATRAVIEREVPGIAEAARAFGQAMEPRAMFSRAIAGVRGRTLIVNLPGSPRGVRESLAALLPALLHAAPMIAGEGHGE